jgi:RNA polymerase sigma-70 factor, ECF subfamily
MDPDLELLERWRAGDQRAGGELLTRHFNGLRVYFLARIGGDPADRIQETFKRMTEARDRFAGRSSVRTYLFRIARNVLCEELRKRNRPQGAFEPLVESIADATGRRHSSILAHNQELELLLDALCNIPSEQQDILELHYFHEMSQVELADVFQVPQGTMKSRMLAARRKLLDKFNELSGQTRDVTALEGALTAAREAALRCDLRKAPE